MKKVSNSQNRSILSSLICLKDEKGILLVLQSLLDFFFVIKNRTNYVGPPLDLCWPFESRCFTRFVLKSMTFQFNGEEAKSLKFNDKRQWMLDD